MIKRLCLGLIRAYQLCLSPVLGNRCRYLPTCSDYMTEAITHWGVWRGIWLGLKRLARCHPWHDGGYDPVPGPPST